MPKRIGVFVDVSNIYHCANAKFGKKLNYSKYMDFCQSLGNVVIANAYGAQLKNQAGGFLKCLKSYGYTPIYQTPKRFINNGQVQYKANYDLLIAVEIVDAITEFDLLILGSADGDFAPLLNWVQSQDKNIIVFACNISQELKDFENYIEIPESYMEE